MEGLKAKTTRGVFWSFMDSFGVHLVKFGFSIFIARTLSPEDYGLMGLIVIFIALGQVFMQSGFSMALIQKKETTDTDLSTVFWFNVLAAIIVYLILFLSAGAIASFYNRSELVNITRVAAIGIVFNSLCSVQVAILTKSMSFKRLTWINLVGALVSGITGLVLALGGYAVWALVLQTLAGNVIFLAGLWLTSSWRPAIVFNIQSFRSLFGFGYKILLQGLMDVLFTKIYFPLIGKFYSAAQLGFYTNANRFYEIFIRQTATSVTRVMFPAFSAIQDQRERFNNNYVKSFNMLAVVMSAGSLLLIISSRPFVSLALTDKWLPAVPLMQLFFIEGFLFPLLFFNMNILNSLGKSGMSLRIDMIKKGFALISIILLFRYGIEALIIGQVATTGIALAISLAAVSREQGVRLGDVTLPSARLLLILTVCLLFSIFVIEPLNIPQWAELLLKFTVTPGIFIGLGWLFRLTAVRELRILINDYRESRSGR